MPKFAPWSIEMIKQKAFNWPIILLDLTGIEYEKKIRINYHSRRTSSRRSVIVIIHKVKPLWEAQRKGTRFTSIQDHHTAVMMINWHRMFMTSTFQQDSFLKPLQSHLVSKNTWKWLFHLLCVECWLSSASEKLILIFHRWLTRTSVRTCRRRMPRLHLSEGETKIYCLAIRFSCFFLLFSLPTVDSSR